MKTDQFKSLVREEIKRVLKEADDLEGLYDVIDNPAAAKLQKAVDAKYKKLYYAIEKSPALKAAMESYMNRTDSFETSEDFKNYNEGLINIFTMAVKEYGVTSKFVCL